MNALRGFTLIEIVTVLVIISVLALFTASTLLDNGDTASYAERDRLLSTLVQARAQGMAMGGGQCVSLSPGGVSFSIASGAAQLPSLLSAYSFSTPAGQTLNFCFDAAGSSCAETQLQASDGTPILFCTATADQTIRFGNASLTLIGETGFIQ